MLNLLVKSVFIKGNRPKDLNFGRFVNGYKSEEAYMAWNKSIHYFKQKRYFDGYEQLFYYLLWYKNSHSKINLFFTREDNFINFTLFQGKSIIHGNVTKELMSAFVNIANIDTYQKVIYRRVLEYNYRYTYSRFYIDSKNILCMKINLTHKRVNPQKIISALKELAIFSDKESALLLNEFPLLKRVESAQVDYFSKKELDTKYSFLLKWIKDVDKNIKSLDTHDDNGAISFYLLTTALRIDYLINIQCSYEYDILDMINNFFDEESKSIEERNSILKNALDEFLTKDKEQIIKSLYIPNNTFSPIRDSSIEEVMEFINSYLDKTITYQKLDDNQTVLIICEYIALYSLYVFDIYECLRELMHLLIKVINNDFFKEFGYKEIYNQKIQKRKINEEIKEILSSYKHEHPNLKNFINVLEFDSIKNFSKSYLVALSKLDFKA